MLFQETERTELKRVFNDSLPKEIVAFLNSFDGTVYIGVEDDGTVVGVNNLDETQKKIADVITDQILPNPQELVEIGSKYVDGKNVVEVKVKKGNALYYIKKYGRSASGCFIRVGTSCRSMTEEQIESLFRKTSEQGENLITARSKWEPISFTQLKIYYAGKNLHLNDETMASNLELFVPGTNRYNRLAELLSDENRVSIQFARFHGFDKASFAETSEYGHQCLITAIERMVNRLEAENFTKSTITSKQRIDKRLIDADCLKEAFYNAIAHNDWSVVEPSVYMFDDRIEIISHGGLPAGETVDMFYRGISKPRNPALMRVLRDLGYVERTGHGVPNIVAKYGQSAFEIAPSYINVVLPFDTDVMVSRKRDATANGTVNGTVNGIVKLSDNESALLRELRNDGQITIQQLASTLNCSRRTVARILQKMRENGILERVGSDKTGYWRIK